MSIPPIDLAAAIATPVAIVHGDRDRYVALTDARALHQRLATPHRLVVLSKFGHGEAAFGPELADLLAGLIREMLDEATNTADEP